jgi:hypothetical protein
MEGGLIFNLSLRGALNCQQKQEFFFTTKAQRHEDFTLFVLKKAVLIRVWKK